MSDAGDTDAGDAGGTAAEHGLQTTARHPDELRTSLEGWLETAGLATGVRSLEIPSRSGISSLSVMVEIEPTPAARNAGLPDRLVARLAPDASGVPVFPAYDLEKQFLVLDHIARHGQVPVPRVHRLELDPEPLGVPFFVMDWIDGEIPPDVMPYPFGSWLSEAALPDQRRLQDRSIAILAAVHDVGLTAALGTRLSFDRAGSTPLERHVAEQRAYYEWCAADGVRSSVIEAGFSWLERHWPSGIDDGRLSWGDARIGNMIFRDFAPVALLDWEMVGVAPPEVDLGWMIYLHRWFDDIAAQFEIEPMRHFMRVPDAVAAYEAAHGARARALRWFLFYAALRHGIVMFRVSRRPIALGQGAMPDDPNDLIMHRGTLEQMMSGEYWAGFEA